MTYSVNVCDYGRSVMHVIVQLIVAVLIFEGVALLCGGNVASGKPEGSSDDDIRRA